jgi:4-hydroxy-tetrahydrodipicolinate synthase
MDTTASTLELHAIAPTQFSEDARSVDDDAMAANMERLAGAGISRVLLTGSYGEFTALSDHERLDILDRVRATGVCDSVMACAASTSTEGTAGLAIAMLEHGADTAMVAPPLASEVSERDILRHFEYLGAAVGRDLVVYNNPAFGHDLEPRVLAEVMTMDAYVGVKQGTRDLPRLLASIEGIRATGRDVTILIASDLSAPVALAAGVDGLTSTNSWVFPDALQRLVAAAGSGDIDTMREVHRALAPYRHVLGRVGQPAGVKAAMQLRGYAGSLAVRGPYVPCSGDDLDLMRAALDDSDAALRASVTRLEVVG